MSIKLSVSVTPIYEDGAEGVIDSGDADSLTETDAREAWWWLYSSYGFDAW
jgi:hypothetical protein